MREYWHVDQSWGGVYTLPHTTSSGHVVNAIGSSGCRSCVCVFVELSNTECFAAHISAIDHAADCTAGKRKPTPEQRITDNRSRMVPDDTKAQQLVEIVVKNLRDTFPNRVAGGTFNGKVGRSMVVCPMKIWGGERAMGSFIIRALEEFFGVTLPCEPGHGFIAIPGIDQWTLQFVGWKNGYSGPSVNDTDYYDAKEYEEGPEKYEWTRRNAHSEPQLGGPWAFAFIKAGSWVYHRDRYGVNGAGSAGEGLR